MLSYTQQAIGVKEHSDIKEPDKQQLPSDLPKHYTGSYSISSRGKENSRHMYQQCDAFLACKIEGSGVLEDPEIRQELYNMRKNAAAHKRHVLRVMSLTR